MSKSLTSLWRAQIKVIFLTYDAENSPYLKTYFLPLLNGLNGGDVEYFVGQITNGAFTSTINLECSEDTQRGQIVKVGRGKGLLTFLRALLLLKSFVKRQDTRESVVIYRSIGGAFMYLTLRLAGVKFRDSVYDSDGLAIQERIETGVWKKFGVKTLLSKSIEILGIISASKILVRSQETIGQITSRKLVSGEKSFCVLVNGRDTEMFSPATHEDRQRIRTELGFNAEDFIVIYVGTIGDQYMVPEMRRVFEEIRTQVVNAKFLILTYAQNEVITTYFGSEESRLDNEMYVLRIAPDLVGRAICIGDVGISLRLPLPSMEHVAPLKYREYLLSGVPVIYSGHTGDQEIVSNVLAHQLDLKRTNSYVEVASWVSTKLVNNREQVRFGARKYGLEKFNVLTDSNKLTKFLNES